MYIERDSFVTDDYFEVIDLLWFLFKNFPKIYTQKISHKIKYKYNSTDTQCLFLRALSVCYLAVQSAMLYACFVCGKNTLCKHLHIERYCLLLADRCGWCVYLSMKLIPINNKLKRCLNVFTMKTSHTHTQTHPHPLNSHDDDCKRLWDKGVSIGIDFCLC